MNWPSISSDSGVCLESVCGMCSKESLDKGKWRENDGRDKLLT
jgi:hypothetical protein